MVDEMRDVLGEPVEIRGGYFVCRRPAGGSRYYGGPDTYHLGGGYVAGLVKFTTGTAQIELTQVGGDTPVNVYGFDTHAEAAAEFERVKATLMERERVRAVVDLLYVVTGVLPAEFLPSVRAGDLEALLIAADFRDDQGETDKALLLRSAYYRLTGQANVTVKANKKTTVVFNPQVVTKRRPAGRNTTGLGELAAAVVVAGESVRVVSLDTNKYTPVVVLAKEFRVGSQAEFDSFNLCYYGPVLSITAKTVAIDKQRNPGETARLTIAKFVEKNHDFDLAKARKRNDDYLD